MLTFFDLSLANPTTLSYVRLSPSNVYPRKPVHSSKPACLGNARPKKPIISSNVSLSKSVCSRSVYSGKIARPSDLVLPGNVCPSKPADPSNVCLGKRGYPSDIF